MLYVQLYNALSLEQQRYNNKSTRAKSTLNIFPQENVLLQGIKNRDKFYVVISLKYISEVNLQLVIVMIYFEYITRLNLSY